MTVPRPAPVRCCGHMVASHNAVAPPHRDRAGMDSCQLARDTALPLAAGTTHDGVIWEGPRPTAQRPILARAVASAVHFRFHGLSQHPAPHHPLMQYLCALSRVPEPLDRQLSTHRLFLASPA
jgi:hypothetical protein